MRSFTRSISCWGAGSNQLKICNLKCVQVKTTNAARRAGVLVFRLPAVMGFGRKSRQISGFGFPEKKNYCPVNPGLCEQIVFYSFHQGSFYRFSSEDFQSPTRRDILYFPRINVEYHFRVSYRCKALRPLKRLCFPDRPQIFP